VFHDSITVSILGSSALRRDPQRTDRSCTTARRRWADAV